MSVGHDPTVTVAPTLVAPLHASVQSPATASVSPGARFTAATASSDPRAWPARCVTKCTITEAAPWYVAWFLIRATGMVARSNVPMPTPRTSTERVSGGNAVGDAVGRAVGVGDGVGVGGAVA